MRSSIRIVSAKTELRFGLLVVTIEAIELARLLTVPSVAAVSINVITPNNPITHSTMNIFLGEDSKIAIDAVSKRERETIRVSVYEIYLSEEFCSC
jgi:hypothetical protein